jgi:site-specific recombinase XerC
VAISNESINKTLVLLANILDTAVEHGLLPSNPARGKPRRLKADRPPRRFLEADELAELLAVAGELDRSARFDQRIGRRPMVAVMAKSGLRVGGGLRAPVAVRQRSPSAPFDRAG